MSGIRLPAVTSKRRPWNRGRLVGQKRPLVPKPVWAIRARLELSGNPRDLALFNFAIDSKLRGCDLVRRKVVDLVVGDRVRDRVSVIESKTNRPVQVEVTENTRASIRNWVSRPDMIGCAFLIPSRFHDGPHVSRRHCARLVHDWVSAIGLEPSGYRTHSLRRTKAAQIYRMTGNLRAVQLLLGHTKVDSTVRYLGVEIEDALSIAEGVDIRTPGRTAPAVRLPEPNAGEAWTGDGIEPSLTNAAQATYGCFCTFGGTSESTSRFTSATSPADFTGVHAL